MPTEPGAPDSLVVRMNPDKSWLSLFASIVLTGLMVWAFFRREAFQGNFAMTALVFAAGAFFAIMAVRISWRLVRNDPVLVIDRSGIFDNVSLLRLGPLPWAEISSVAGGGSGKNRTIYFNLADPGASVVRIAGMRGRWVRLKARAGLHVAVLLGPFDRSEDEIVAAIERFGKGKVTLEPSLHRR